jgi:hypothetical protein
MYGDGGRPDHHTGFEAGSQPIHKSIESCEPSSLSFKGVDHMRRGFGILGLVATLVLLAVVGFFAYQVGYSDGFAQHAPAGTTPALAPYPFYYGGFGFFHFGWIFGLLFFLFFVFLLFRIVAFGIWGGPRHRGGWVYGGVWGMYGGGIPPAIDERMKEWHRQAHGEPAQSTPSTPPPPPGQDQ